MTQQTDRALKMVETALAMEEKGKGFYQKALEKTKNELGRDIFEKLRDDEDVHVVRIRKIVASLSGGTGWTDAWKAHQPEHADLGVVFRKLAKKHGTGITTSTDDIDALQVGLDFEQEAVSFYKGHLEEATDPIEKEFIERMVQEERSHFAALKDMKFYLENPEAWMEEKERSLLDGA